MTAVKIVAATRAQAETIIRRLKAEFSDEDGGFYHDRDIIRKASRESELSCLCRGRTILGFGVFTLGSKRSKIDILEVFPAYRGHGYGQLLAHHLIQFLFTSGAQRIDLECAPSSSESFWRMIGFVDHELSRSGFGRPMLTLRSWPNNSFKPRSLRGRGVVR